MLSRLGKLDESLKLLHHLQDEYVSIHGENDPRTLRTKSQMAVFHYKKNEFSKAGAIWRQVEAPRRQMFGETHPYIISVRNHIAECKAKLSQRANRANHCHIV